jgi:hypothetical protein
MLTATGAMEYVDVRHALGRISLGRIPSLDIVVFWMPAARRNLLVLLQIPLIIAGRNPCRAFGHLHPLTGEDMCALATITRLHQASVARLAP